MDIQPLSKGWHCPSYEQLATAGEYTDTALLWCFCDGWPEEYQIGAFGIWSWNPVDFDWEQTREAIYRLVYGPNQIKTAKEFDDTLKSLKELFYMPERHYIAQGEWPPRLKNIGDRPKALALIEKLDAKCQTLEANATGESCLEPMRLQGVYLEPMRETVHYARKMAVLDFPEYKWGTLGPRIFPLLKAGKKDEVQKLLDEARPEVEKQVEQVVKELGDLAVIDIWASRWHRRVSGVKRWEDALANEERKK